MQGRGSVCNKVVGCIQRGEINDCWTLSVIKMKYDFYDSNKIQKEPKRAVVLVGTVYSSFVSASVSNFVIKAKKYVL